MTPFPWKYYNWKTCFKKTTGTSIDILLTNWPRSFLKMGIFETGLSDHHKLILSFFRSFFKDSTKTIQYRKYKTFTESSFLHELDQEPLKGICIKAIETSSHLLQKPSEELLINMYHWKWKGYEEIKALLWPRS